MHMSQKPLPPKTGIARPATMVLMAPARAVSSHLRKHYEERYKPRYRFAGWVFGFDVFLAGLATCLALVNIVLWHQAAQPAFRLEASIYAPTIIASEIIPIEVVVSATDGKTHRDVRLTWELPPSVEVLDASPQKDFFGTVRLGDILPLQVVRAQLHIRVRAQVGDKVPIRIRLVEGMWGQGIEGVDMRHVESGALQSGMAWQATSIVPGATLPLRIRNTGEDMVGPVVIRIVQVEGAEVEFGQNQAMGISRLLGHAQQIVPLSFRTIFADTVQVTWQMEQGGRIIERKTASWKKSSLASIPEIQVKTQGNGSVEIETPIAVHTLSANGEQSVSPGKTNIAWPEEAQDGTVYVSLQEADGGMTMLPAMQFPVKIQVPLASEARYYASTGDQIGVGPHPPRVGEETTYWLFWRLGPIPAALKGSRVQATLRLADRVQATGAFSAPSGGEVQMEKGEITWTIPQLEAGAVAEYGMEVWIQPTKQDIGHAFPLTSSSTFRIGDLVQISGPVDTRLHGDSVVSSTGEVLPAE